MTQYDMRFKLKDVSLFKDSINEDLYINFYVSNIPTLRLFFAVYDTINGN